MTTIGATPASSQPVGSLPSLPPPSEAQGVLGWLRRNLFSTPGNSVLTVLLLAVLAWLVPKALNWLVFEAVWGAQPVAACDAARGKGACCQVGT